MHAAYIKDNINNNELYFILLNDLKCTESLAKHTSSSDLSIYNLHFAKTLYIIIITRKKEKNHNNNRIKLKLITL